jgi:sigma-E factor negative regulatory protein RseC
MAQRLTKIGVVRAVQGRIALVVTRLEPECESCKARHTCSSLGGGGADMEVRARNTVGAQVGDVVTISLGSAPFLKLTFFVYMVPILALVGSALCGYWLSTFSTANKDLFVGGFGAFGFFGSFFWLRKKANKLSGRQEFIPEIISKQSPVKTIPPSDASCPVS